jgi:ATP-dependent helicase HepA
MENPRAVFVTANVDELRSLGTAKVLAHTESWVQIAYFDGPTSELVLHEVDPSVLQAVQLSRQRRAYSKTVSGVWEIGRVLEHGEDGVYVRFPNGQDRLLNEEDVFVRWSRPLVDPAPYLARQNNETPLFADARTGFVAAMVVQRAAAKGMSALISSKIELEPHQIEVVRRVLQDPVQRYLLADEVGLGKTIEAGVLIRQHVLDDPAGHRVTILVPPPLVGQWCEELSDKFSLQAQLGKTVEVLPSDDLSAATTALKRATMVVIDEAHHLTEVQALYEVVRVHTQDISRFLLLSATPVLGNEQGFLEMLHLLDPIVFPLDDSDRFARKIGHRQSLAEASAGLIPENVLQLDEYLDTLDEQFPDDVILVELLQVLRSLLVEMPEQEDATFQTALFDLRAHLSETYRLDRRILRNRRAAVPGLTPERAGPRFCDFVSDAAASLCGAIEAWRSEIGARIYGEESTAHGLIAAERVTEVIAAVLAVSPDLLVLLERSRDEATESHWTQEVELLGRAIGAADALLVDEKRLDVLAAVIHEQDSGTSVIVFCSHERTADRVAEGLRRRIESPVARYEPLDSDAQADDNLVSFFSPAQRTPNRDGRWARRCRVLVCDQRAEEGLNFQGGRKHVIHYDLPFSPNRVEQRMGRLDRYGSGDAITSILLRCTSDPYEVAWCECLDLGLGVFNRSIASLQYLVERQLRGLYTSVLTQGSDALTEWASRMTGPGGEVEREFRRIDQQVALDALDAPLSDTWEALFEVDGDWKTQQRAVYQWLVGALQMQQVRVQKEAVTSPEDIFRFQFSLRDRPTLIPTADFLAHMADLIDTRAPGGNFRRPLTYPYAYRRQTAMSRAAVQNKTRLLRYGDPLLQGFSDLTELDDRGRCFAMWRLQPDHIATEIASLFFRFDYLVEVDTELAVDWYRFTQNSHGTAVAPAMSRRGDMVFPPFFKRIWIDADLESVVDAHIIAVLDASYSKLPREDEGYDRNLNTDRWQAVCDLGVPQMENWSELVIQAARSALGLLERETDLRALTEQAVRSAEKADSRRFAQLRTRIAQGEGPMAEADSRHLRIEQEVAEALYRGIRNPKITLDTIGAVFVSSTELPESSLATEEAPL